MNTNSNTYIFTYATVLVLVVAVVLAVVSTVLKPIQQDNVKNEKMQNILAAAMTKSQASNLNSDNANEKYDKFIKEELVINEDGDVLNSYVVSSNSNDPERAFNIDLKTELEKKKSGEKAKFPIYIFESGNRKCYVVPVRGVGLWGPIWGYIALSKDCSTIAGTVFDHKAETPGLGAEIATPKFEKRFIGKNILNDKGEFTSILVVKGGIEKIPQDQRIHAIDAISGSTITCEGVGAMLKDCLVNYTAYFDKVKK